MMRSSPVRTPLLALLSLAGALVACSAQSSAPAAERGTAPAASADPSIHPASGLAVIPLTVRTEEGTHSFRVELASSAQDQARGLMFRASMGPDEGMLFPTGEPQVRSFWMKNTVIPLDLIFIGPDRRVVNVAANAVPYSEANLVSEAPVIAVLELNGGRAEELGIGPGALVSW